MPYLIGKDETYDTLRPLLDEEAKQILEKQLPRIRQRIDEEIDSFAKSFGDYIQQEVGKLSETLKTESEAAQKRLQDITTDIAKSAGDPTALKAASEELKKEVEAYKQKWLGLGETTRKSVLTAAKAAGIPLPL